jgi:hypothetical protein
VSEEVWKDVVGYEKLYQVSTKGRIRSIPRKVPCRYGKFRVSPGKILKPTLWSKLWHVDLYKRGNPNTCLIHRLILESFIGPCPEGMECCHWDGDTSNNRLDNLRWDTHKNNCQDQIRHGTTLRGDKNGMAKLTEGDVITMRKMYQAGRTSLRKVAELFNVSHQTVYRIINKTTWKHVK